MLAYANTRRLYIGLLSAVWAAVMVSTHQIHPFMLDGLQVIIALMLGAILFCKTISALAVEHAKAEFWYCAHTYKESMFILLIPVALTLLVPLLAPNAPPISHDEFINLAFTELMTTVLIMSCVIWVSILSGKFLGLFR